MAGKAKSFCFESSDCTGLPLGGSILKMYLLVFELGVMNKVLLKVETVK